MTSLANWCANWISWNRATALSEPGGRRRPNSTWSQAATRGTEKVSRESGDLHADRIGNVGEDDIEALIGRREELALGDLNKLESTIFEYRAIDATRM
jgi:hypothetical protein